MASHNHIILSKEIILLSESDDWVSARKEWQLETIYFDDESSRCLCSHYPINEVCVLKNTLNDNSTEVGNVCVNKFLGIPSKIIFDGLKRVSVDQSKALNEAATDYIHTKKWINDWEFGFLLDTKDKRILSLKQAVKRRQINEKILAWTKRSKG